MRFDIHNAQHLDKYLATWDVANAKDAKGAEWFARGCVNVIVGIFRLAADTVFAIPEIIIISTTDFSNTDSDATRTAGKAHEQGVAILTSAPPSSSTASPSLTLGQASGEEIKPEANLVNIGSPSRRDSDSASSTSSAAGSTGSSASSVSPSPQMTFKHGSKLSRLDFDNFCALQQGNVIDVNGKLYKIGSSVQEAEDVPSNITTNLITYSVSGGKNPRITFFNSGNLGGKYAVQLTLVEGTGTSPKKGQGLPQSVLVYADENLKTDISIPELFNVSQGAERAKRAYVGKMEGDALSQAMILDKGDSFVFNGAKYVMMSRNNVNVQSPQPEAIGSYFFNPDNEVFCVYTESGYYKMFAVEQPVVINQSGILELQGFNENAQNSKKRSISDDSQSVLLRNYDKRSLWIDGEEYTISEKGSPTPTGGSSIETPFLLLTAQDKRDSFELRCFYRNGTAQLFKLKKVENNYGSEQSQEPQTIIVKQDNVFKLVNYGADGTSSVSTLSAATDGFSTVYIVQGDNQYIILPDGTDQKSPRDSRMDFIKVDQPITFKISTKEEVTINKTKYGKGKVFESAIFQDNAKFQVTVANKVVEKTLNDTKKTLNLINVTPGDYTPGHFLCNSKGTELLVCEKVEGSVATFKVYTLS